MSKPTDYRLEDQIGFKLRLANQKHLDVFSKLLPDVTPTQFAVLAKLNETGSISQNHLGRLVGMDAATTKGVVDRLKKKGFVFSAQSQTDLRRLEITLTQTGKDFTAKTIENAHYISTHTAANLSTRELHRLLVLLEKL